MNCPYDFQPRTHGPPRVIFMGRGITEIHQQPVAQILGNVSLMALDHRRAGLLILPHDFTQVFGIKLSGKRGRAN